MDTNLNERHEASPRWGYLLLAALIFVFISALLAGLWHLPKLAPQLAGPSAMSRIPPTRTSTTSPSTPNPSALLRASPTPTFASPTPTVTPRPTPTPAPTLAHPTITELTAEVDEQARTITFRMAAKVPPDRQVDEVLLWYDTEIGHELQHIAGPLPPNITLSHQLDAAQEGLTTTVTSSTPWPDTLDYWWQVRDTTGESVRAGGMVTLGPALQALVTTPTPEPPPIDFTWVMSQSQHFSFHVVPSTAAERDLQIIGPLAEAALGRISSRLEVEFDDQMSVYLVPRIFWQGGAAYGEKVQLISYLDRNYTGIETWSYFTHEGTHALAQDLLQPKEDGTGPDGVLVEGLAVWASSGHYRQEPLDTWAAVVASSDSYIPLADLRAGPFYDFQHELAYLEAASFVKFLIEEYGLDRLKELYGQATGDAANDEKLVQSLYGLGYAELEADWLDYLDGLEPTPEQAETWDLTVRSFDLMRRYETELDPDARLLPPNPPPEWITDTLAVFLHRLEAQTNVTLETALIAIQDRLYSGDLRGATALLEDVEAVLDTGTTDGRLNRPSLQARQALIELVAAQDRAILRADAAAYLDTVEPALRHRSGQASTLVQRSAVESLLGSPLTAFRQEVVRLDVDSDGASAEGVVLVHARLAEGEMDARSRALVDDGQLYAVAFANVEGGWFMTSRRRMDPILAPLPPDSEGVP